MFHQTQFDKYKAHELLTSTIFGIHSFESIEKGKAEIGE